MNQSPETKILRDLVTQIKRGKEPDITAVESLIARSSLTAEYAGAEYLKALTRFTRKCYLAGQRVMCTPSALALRRSYAKLIAERDRVNSNTREQKYRKLNMIYTAALDGKLTKKQFDQAIKELCK